MADNMEKNLQEIIERYKDTEGALIPVLHEAQELYGYLPMEVQLAISKGLQIPLAEIYGVVSFYSQFSTEPKGKYRISVCLGTACYVKGAQEILQTFESRLGIEVGQCTDDGMFSIEPCRCVGACGLAPVVTINDEVYGKLVPDDVDRLIDKYMKDGEAEA
ncbi:MAG: NADH-quinone oxidoreductase subunit NuoE [Firmicutes bacterium]|nr:NADH-quinone oxidoreductase subunit NuoE [Bacillota bacterium]